MVLCSHRLWLRLEGGAVEGLQAHACTPAGPLAPETRSPTARALALLGSTVSAAAAGLGSTVSAAAGAVADALGLDAEVAADLGVAMLAAGVSGAALGPVWVGAAAAAVGTGLVGTATLRRSKRNRPRRVAAEEVLPLLLPSLPPDVLGSLHGLGQGRG